MNVVVNGESRTLPAGATVAVVLSVMEVASPARGVAVAVDGEVVRQSEWESAVLSEGARVEVLGAIGGGR